jgi:hypothetical protein
MATVAQMDLPATWVEVETPTMGASLPNVTVTL